MGKLSKLFIFLIFIIAVGFPCVTIKVNNMMQNQESEVKQLGVFLKDTEGKLQTSEKERGSLETSLSTEKGKRKTAERNLKSTQNQMNSVKSELSKNKNQLSTCAAEKKTLQNEMAKLQNQKSEMETKYLKQAAELASLKGNITAQNIGTGPVQGGKGIHEQGAITGITGNRYVTISLRKGIGLKKNQKFFVYRRGKVLGKVNAREVYGATVVIENSDKDIVSRIIEGDLVKLDGEKLLESGFLEGKATNVSPSGFAAINANEESRKKINTVFAIYRDANLIGKLGSERVVSLLVIADIVPIRGRRVRMSENDFLRMPR